MRLDSICLHFKRFKRFDLFKIFVRCSAAQNEVSQLKLDSKTKCEENQRLQKQITQYEEHTEELQESLSNIRKEKQQLLERYTCTVNIFIYLN